MTGTKTDKDLVRKLRKGDEDSFRLLFERYYDRLFSFAYAILRDKYLVEDTIQNVFLKLWIGRERVDEDRSLQSYLLKSVRNEILNTLRLKYNSSVVHEVVDREDDSSDTEGGLLFVETSARIRSLVEAMPPQRQRCFMLSRYENKSVKEIALETNLSERTVERHIYLALKQIKSDFS